MAKTKSSERRRSSGTTEARPAASPAVGAGPTTWFWAAIVLLAIVPLVLFGSVTDFKFVSWDDNENVTENPLYQPTPSEHYGELWTVPYYAAYIPITRLVWAALADPPADAGRMATFDPITSPNATAGT